VEGAAVVETLAGEREEVLDVPGRFVGSELEAEGAEIGVTTASDRRRIAPARRPSGRGESE